MTGIAALDRKLLRDLWRLRGQVLAVALVIAAGVGVIVMSLTALEALRETAITYYERFRFAQVFAEVKRAPEHLVARIREIPGVQSVATRVVRTAVLDVAGFAEPVIGKLVSLPPDGGALNRIALGTGRLPHPERPDEVVVSAPFAEAHGLVAGGRLRAVINGHWRELDIVGTALSPEYVYAIAPGALMPDDRRFGVLWMGHKALQAAWDLDGAFNDLAVGLLRGTDSATVIGHIDRILARYGGIGAFDRADQVSNWFLMNELAQLETISTILPAIFLAVAAYLTNLVMARLVTVERAEIGLLKAFGYSNRAVAWHYLKLVAAIGVLGCIIGWAVGYVLGQYNTAIYAKFYRFPFLVFRPGPAAFIIGALVSLAAALAGTLGALRAVVRLPPAEAMRPPAPPLFRRSRLARLPGLERLDQLTRIFARQIGRWPLRALITSAGIGMAVGVLIMALQWMDAIEHLVTVYFEQAQVQDVTVGFSEPLDRRALFDLDALPGVMSSEGMRIVPARLRHGHRVKREALQGLPAVQSLFQVYDVGGRAVTLPDAGLVLSSALATHLAVRRGDMVTVEILEGRRRVVEVPVAAVFETYIGTPAYMEINALGRLLLEGPSVSVAHLRVDARQSAALYRALKTVPRVSAVTVRRAAIGNFYDTLAETIYIYTSFFVVFACVLAFGVTYNAARIALSERGRELATLRVLGFTRAEISYVLLGEIGLLTVCALPLGCAFGYALARVMVNAFATELYRVPMVLEPSTYAWAVMVGIIATAGSALLVRRRLDRLDLIAVLKTRE